MKRKIMEALRVAGRKDLADAFARHQAVANDLDVLDQELDRAAAHYRAAVRRAIQTAMKGRPDPGVLRGAVRRADALIDQQQSQMFRALESLLS